jgi:peptidoglycan/LPS O-acetylase OafA/YrhL
LLLQDLFGTGHINYVFWSIAVEWHIYFLFPLLVLSWRRYGPWFTVTAALILGFALRFAFGDTRLARANPHFIGMFALGVLAAYVAFSPRETYVRARQRIPWTWLGILGFAAACGLTMHWGVMEARERFHFLDLPVGLMATSALVLSSRSESLLRRVFSWKPLAVVGTFSYSVYLIHAPALQIVWQYGSSPAHLGPEATFAFLMTVGLGFALLAAYVFYLAFEAPFLRKSSPGRLTEAVIHREVAVLPLAVATAGTEVATAASDPPHSEPPRPVNS